VSGASNGSADGLASVRNDEIAVKRVEIQLPAVREFSDILKMNSISRFSVFLRRIEIQDQYLDIVFAFGFGRVIYMDADTVKWPITLVWRKKFSSSLDNPFYGSDISNRRRRNRNASA
jgi:hypothetical protein